jgi:hypothetical protein
MFCDKIPVGAQYEVSDCADCPSAYENARDRCTEAGGLHHTRPLLS